MRLLLLFILFNIYSPENGVCKTDTVEIDRQKITYENALYDFYRKKYAKVAPQFADIIEKYPQDINDIPLKQQKQQAINYYLTSLSYLQQNEKIKEIFQRYLNLIQVDTIFTIIENLQKWDKYDTVIDILGYLKKKKLSNSETAVYQFLMAESFIFTGNFKQGIDHINLIPKGSYYYYYGNILLSRLFFKDGDIDGSIEVLKEILEELKNSGRFNSIKDKVILMQGQIYFEKGEYHESIKYFKDVKRGDYFYDAQAGIQWAYLKSEDFVNAAKILKLAKEVSPTRFIQDRLELNLGYSYYYEYDFPKAAASFKEFLTQIKHKKELMNRLLDDDEECIKFSYLLIKDFFGVQTSEELVITKEERDSFNNFIRVNQEFLLIVESYSYVSNLAVESVSLFNMINKYYSIFENRYGYNDTFLRNVMYDNNELREKYTDMKEEILAMEFERSERVRSNVSFFKELLKENMAKYTAKREYPLSHLEKKLLQMLTYESMYSQKLDMRFLNKIINGDNSLERLAKRSTYEWAQKAKSILKPNSKGLLGLKKLSVMKRNLEGYVKEIKKLKDNILRMVIPAIRKEAFRVISEIEFVEDEVEEVFEISTENL